MSGVQIDIDGMTAHAKASLLGDLQITIGEKRWKDIYIIRFEDSLSRRGRLRSFYLLDDGENFQDPRLNDLQYFPIKLSTLCEQAQQHPGFATFMRQLNAELVKRLLDVGMDNLAAYALLHNHPEMQMWFHKPLLIMVAYHSIYRFDQLGIRTFADFRDWFPTLCRVPKITKGMIRLLARLDLSDPEAAAQAARLIVSDFPKLRRLIPDQGTIFPFSIRLATQLINTHPELAEARWLSTQTLTSTAARDHIEMIYKDTRRLLEERGDANIPSQLLRRPRTLDELATFHDMLAESYNSWHCDYPPETTFITRHVRDSDKLKVICNVDELRRVAVEMHNCALMFAVESIEGQKVHLLYDDGHEMALLQLDFQGQNQPRVSEFSAKCNLPVSEKGWAAALEWLELQRADYIASLWPFIHGKMTRNEAA